MQRSTLFITTKVGSLSAMANPRCSFVVPAKQQNIHISFELMQFIVGRGYVLKRTYSINSYSILDMASHTVKRVLRRLFMFVFFWGGGRGGEWEGITELFAELSSQTVI